MKKWIPALILLLGGYNCFAQKILTHQQAVEDIDFYTRTMRESHYAPFLYISRDEYDTRIAAIKKTIGDSITLKDFVFLFYQVTALLNDAHSTPQLGQPLFQEEFKKEQFFPYKLVQQKNKLYLPVQSARALNLPAGAEITGINGEDLPTVFEQTANRIAGTPAFRKEVACKLISYFLFLKGVKPPFVITYTDANGRTQQTILQTGVGFRNALSASMPHIIRPYTSDIIQQKLGYIDLRSLSGNTASFRAFLDTCFLQFKKAGIRNLAIDLRKNSGGNTALGDLLFGYITHKKYSWGMKSWRISQAYKDMLKAGGDTSAGYWKKPNGSVWESGDSCHPEKSRFSQPGIFEGHVFFITGPFTFSSAMAMADVVKTYRIGTLIGGPTGENAMDFGEAFTISLPNSNLKIQSTSSFSHGANCNRTENGPVQPDIPVSNTLQDDIQERDRAVEYLLGLIK